MQAMKEAQERRMKMERTGHGCLNEIDEKEFLPEVTTTKHVVAHFIIKSLSGVESWINISR